MKKFIAGLAVAAMLVPAAFADVGNGGGGRHRGASLRRLTQRLNLTEDQRAQMRMIAREEREKNASLFQAARTKRQELRSLKQANDSRAESVKAELKAIHTQIRAARQATRDRMLSVLTSEQRQQLEEMRSKRHRQ